MESVELARAATPRGEVVLRAREEPSGTVLELRVNGVFVMDTLETSTERALAGTALDLVTRPRRVLVGGLGMGFTAQALLDDPRVERIDVVELEDALIGWMRDGTIPHGPALLAQERVRVLNADVAHAVQAIDEPAYDLVLLDVDNGPGYLVHDTNARVYQPDFLARCRSIVHPGGVLVVWSADRAPQLARHLHDVFGNCTERALPVLLQGREEDYHLYLARVTSGP
jgi:spermidine synthase